MQARHELETQGVDDVIDIAGMETIIENVESRDASSIIGDGQNLTFGKIFTDRMLKMKYNEGNWENSRVTSYQPLEIDPAAIVLQYGQSIFEGMKCFPQPDGTSFSLFRPYMNAQRFVNSADRMVMPAVDKDYFVKSIAHLINLERQWVPKDEKSSLYIRPNLISTTAELGVSPGSSYLFFVILCPVGPFFKTGFRPTSIYIEREQTRAAEGGTGSAKCAGNYAASLYAYKKAKDAGCSQVLWLDGKEKKYIEEVGAMNVAFVEDDVIVTPPLTGTILPGVTRDSLLKLAPDLGYKIIERKLNVFDVLEGIKSGSISEGFAMGTAAVVTPIGSMTYGSEKYIVNNGEVGSVSSTLYKNLVGIQRGTIEDKYGWNVSIEELVM